jgi:hypothetical protein
MRWAGHEARVRETRNAYRVLVGNTEGNRPLGRHSRRRKDNTNLILKIWEGSWGQYRHDRDQDASRTTSQSSFDFRCRKEISLPLIFQTALCSTRLPGEQSFPGVGRPKSDADY